MKRPSDVRWTTRVFRFPRLAAIPFPGIPVERGSTSVWRPGLLTIALLSFACGPASSPELAVTVELASGQDQEVFPADHLGVVALEETPPRTVVSVEVGEAMAKLAAGADRVEVSVTLPGRLQERASGVFEWVLFGDRNGNGRFDPGEAYRSSWTGGRDGHRLRYEDPSDGSGGWFMVEGGEPLTERPLGDGGSVRLLTALPGPVEQIREDL